MASNKEHLFFKMASNIGFHFYNIKVKGKTKVLEIRILVTVRETVLIRREHEGALVS